MKQAIIQTKPGAIDFHLFESLPYEIYTVENLRSRLPENINNEYLESCYVLCVNGKPKARAALYLNPHLRYQNKKSFCVGNYESVDDASISNALLNYISSRAKQLGAEYLIGPMNGSTWDHYRFSNHHNNPNFFLEPYHHLYYNELFMHSGFAPIARYFSSLDKQLRFDIPGIVEREKELCASGMTMRSINLKDFRNELRKMFEFNELAFQTNFLYTPIAWETFYKKYAESVKIINPEFVLIAEDEEKNIAGFFFCVDDLFNRNEKSLVVKSIARHPDQKWRGLGHVIGNEIIKRASKHGYKSIVHAFMSEQGTSVKISQNYLGESYKNYTLYGKEIQ
jgi:L-amino acid N-acyltransferase YncA